MPARRRPTLFTALALAASMTLLAACGPEHADTTATMETGGDTSSDTDGQPTTGAGPVTSGMCPGDAPTSTSGPGPTGEPTEGAIELCPEHTQVDACCCFETRYPSAGVVCERHDLCQQIVIDDHTPESDERTTACPAAIDCVIAALIVRTPGTVRWRVKSFFGQEVMELHIVGDGTAFISYLYEEDLGCYGDFVARKALKTPAYFADCAMKATALDQFECLRDPVLGDAVETCPATADCG